MRIKTKLWAHQRQMIDFAKSRLDQAGYCWWIAGCATGKTLAVYKLIQEGAYKKTLVITTKGAVSSAWIIDAEKHLSNVNVVAPDKLTVKGKKDALSRITKDVIFVVNYASAMRMWRELRDFGFDFVVADESHKLQSHSSKTSVFLAQLGIEKKLIMTGTPWDDKPLSVFGQVRFLKGFRKGATIISAILGTWTSFFERYAVYYTLDNIKIPTGYKNIDGLIDKVSGFTLWVNSEDVLDLPEEVDIDRFVPFKGELKRAYNELTSEFITHLGEDVLTVDNKLVLALRLHQLTGGFYKPYGSEELKELGDNSKLDECMSIVDEIGGKPLVIFTRFSSDVAKIKAALEKKGIEVKLLVGGTHEHVEWQAGEGQVLLANLSAGSTGVNLSRARYCIYYSIGYSRTDFNQSRYRVRRPGSDLDYPITYYHVLMRNTVDIEIRSALQRKGKVADQLLLGLDKVEL